MAITGWFVQLTTPTETSTTSRDFTETILIKLDNPKTPNKTIEEDPRYPSRFAKHPVRQDFWCIHSSVSQPLDAPNIRTLTSRWSDTIPNALIRNGKPVFDNDPIKRPLKVKLEFYNAPKTIRMAFDQKAVYDPKKGPPKPTIPVTTTAGESLFMQIDNEYPVFQCEKNVKQLPPFMARNRMFTNSDTVKFQGVTFEPLQLLLCGLTLSEVKFGAGNPYYTACYRLMVAFDADGWCEKRRNAGFHEKVVDQVITFGPGGGSVELNHLEAILIGKPGQKHYPSAPVLLTPEGRAYRAPGKGQSNSTPYKDRTGPILSVEGTSGSKSGITDKDFQEAELKFYPRLSIPFAKYVPLI